MRMHPSLTGLRVLREVAAQGSFSAAAPLVALTQSAVSRQIAALEAEVGAALFERRREGVRLTEAGRVLLRHASAALDALELAEQELHGERRAPTPVRLGAFPSAGAVLLPRVAASLRGRPSVKLSTQAGSTRALLRGLRSGSLDLAIVASVPPFRPLDGEHPALVTETLVESELLVALPDGHALAGAESVALADLDGQPWIATRSAPDEPMLGVWPGLPGRARIVHSTPDWLAKLQLVAAGCGLTTVPSMLVPLLPAGVRALRVSGGSRERRRALVARLPTRVGPEIDAVIACLRDVASGIVPRAR